VKVFHCNHCDQLVFFENTVCVKCEHTLAFLPDLMQVASLEPVGDSRWSSPLPEARGRSYRLCQNRSENVCNWAILGTDPNPLCESCRLTRLIPDLSVPGAKEAWYRLEMAKRRVICTLLSLGLPIRSDSEEQVPSLAFQFLANGAPGQAPVLTGHSQGIITVNIEEADDAARERRRHELGEPYRTLLGHLRHEVGHYYWGRLLSDQSRLERFRELFGDDREDYGAALQRHYQYGPKADWQDRFVSAYASAHPWEDWAETWAHYLHMIDTLETAAACGVSVRSQHPGEPALTAPPVEPALTAPPAPVESAGTRFDWLIASWHTLTYVLNNLNRGMGLADAYPFVLSSPAVDKLRFVHEAVRLAAVPQEDGSLAAAPVS
jgi:hypothetical protein